MRKHLKRHAIKADLFFLVPFFLLYAGGAALIVWDLVRRARETGVTPDLNLAGLLSIVFGLILALAGAFTLRTNYSSTLVIREGHKLVVHGVYGVVRHPIYLGAILVALGMPIVTSSWVAIPPMLLLIPLFAYRMRIEERLLLQEFGDEYLKYMARTKRLVPFLY
jgi:protein-S-isoprenylcysteine O-methyltransferase Ste14